MEIDKLREVLKMKEEEAFNIYQDFLECSFKNKDALKFRKKYNKNTNSYEDEGIIYGKNGNKFVISLEDCTFIFKTIISTIEKSIYDNIKKLDGYPLPITYTQSDKIEEDLKKRAERGEKNLKSIEDYQQVTGQIVAGFATITYISSRYRQYSAINNYPDAEKCKAFIDEKFNKLRSVFKDEYIDLTGLSLGEYKNEENSIRDMIYAVCGIDIGNITDNDYMDIIHNQITKEDFMKETAAFTNTIVHRKKIMDKLVEEGYLDINYIKFGLKASDFQILLSKDYKKYSYLIKIMNQTALCTLFKSGVIKSKDFFEAVEPSEMFLYFSVNEILEFCENYDLSSKNLSDSIYKNFMRDKVTPSQFNKFYEIGLVNLDTIVKLNEEFRTQYGNVEKEKELIEKFNSKLVDMFNPKFISKLNLDECSNELNQFINKNLADIYESQKLNLPQSVLFVIDSDKEIGETEKSKKIVDFVSRGVVTFEDVDELQVYLNEDDIIDAFKKNNDISMLNKALELGFVSQECILLNYENEEDLYSLIKNGVTVHILDGFYGKKEIVNAFFNGNLTVNDLQNLNITLTHKELSNVCKDLVIMSEEFIEILKLADDTKYIEELYTYGVLLYSDIYELSDRGVISKTQADEINEQFDIQAGLDKLKEKGGIQGADFTAFDNYIGSGDRLNDIVIDGKKAGRKVATTRKSHAYEKFDKDLKENLWNVLNGGVEPERIPIKNHQAFEDNDYSIIPIVDKKVVIFEGDGRTLILPIKILLEQIDNKWSENDIVGRAKSRKDLAKNDKYVKSAYHSKNWAKKVVDNIASLDKDFNNKEFIKDNKELFDLLAESYEINTNKDRQ